MISRIVHFNKDIINEFCDDLIDLGEGNDFKEKPFDIINIKDVVKAIAPMIKLL